MVLQAATGQSGLALCDAQPIDCVILEFDMPNISAFEFLIKLLPRASHPEIAVIVLTGLSNPFLLEFALKNGALAAFRKTSTSGDMLDAAILKAIATIRKEKTRQDLRESLQAAEPVSGLAREQSETVDEGTHQCATEKPEDL